MKLKSYKLQFMTPEQFTTDLAKILDENNENLDRAIKFLLSNQYQCFAWVLRTQFLLIEKINNLYNLELDFKSMVQESKESLRGLFEEIDYKVFKKGEEQDVAKQIDEIFKDISFDFKK